MSDFCNSGARTYILLVDKLLLCPIRSTEYLYFIVLISWILSHALNIALPLSTGPKVVWAWLENQFASL